MNYLLDTHTVLWFAENSPKLSVVAKETILRQDGMNFVSIVSAWELAIKISLGKIRIDGGVEEFFNIVDRNGFLFLPIKREHIQQAETLPFEHRDPFDRILICAAIREVLTVITHIRQLRFFKSYFPESQ
ncbi:MAG: type II toxin-antitoxin system VapC family toxin [Synergistaceae bacterium]|jgi:PIN domain nuclease of toxin-antitoxin system|nr:type II toxin-antitoxin system VapC family toxin [Synergistaceae bacterium]